MKQLTIIEGSIPTDLKQFLGVKDNDDFIEMRKLVKATDIFLKSHYLKSYGLVKNKLPLPESQIFNDNHDLNEIQEESF